MTKKLTFLPTRDWVVFPSPKTNETDSGIFIPDSAAHDLKKNVLTVLAAGPMCEQVKVGDLAMINPSTEGLLVTIEGQECVMINEFMICGVFPK
jgi:co-chaperonin GroES (HSP10)